MEIEVLYNPFFTSSNNLISLWFARWRMDEDFIILNGDDVFDDAVLKGERGAERSVGGAENHADARGVGPGVEPRVGAGGVCRQQGHPCERIDPPKFTPRDVLFEFAS